MTQIKAQEIVNQIRYEKLLGFYETPKQIALKKQLIAGGFIYSASGKAIPNPYV